MNKRTKQFLFCLLIQRCFQRRRQMIDILRDKIGQLAILAIVPDLFDRIQLGSVSRQPFHIHASAEPPLEPPNAAAMNHPTVNDQNYAFRKMNQQLGHKGFEIFSANIGILYGKIQSQLSSIGRDTDRRDHRQPIPTIPTVMERCSPFGGPGSPNRRLQHKTAFVKKKDGFTVSTSFFLYVANHLWIG